MTICEACGKAEGTHHLTVSVNVFGPKSTRRKVIQFWLCETCELASQQVLADDANRRSRVANRIVQDPEYMSRWRSWTARRTSARLMQEIQKE